MASVLTLVGMGMVVIGGLMIVVSAFRESILWGLGCIVIPFVALFFVATHWPETRKWFLLHVFGWIAYAGGSVLTPESWPEQSVLRIVASLCA